MKALRVAMLLAIASIGTGAAAEIAAAAPESIVIPSQQENYGQLGALWWKWALSIPYEQNPIFDQSGADCAIGQNGGRWFLAGTPGGAFTRSCTLPAGKSIFFPILSVENDYPCPDPTFQPAPGQSLTDFLTYGTGSIPGAVTLVNQASTLQARLDSQNIPIVPSYRGTSNMYSYAGDPSLTATLDPCITGSQQKAVSDGYWLLLAPLSPGHHTIQFGGTLLGTTETVTYSLTVQ